MNKEESFGNSTCEDQITWQSASYRRSFGAVKELFGPEQALALDR